MISERTLLILFQTTKYNLNTDDTIELFTEPDAIVLKKYGMSCIFCQSSDELSDFKGKTVCRNCLNELKKA